MDAGFHLNSAPQIKPSQLNRSNEQQFEEKLTSYVKSSARSTASLPEVKQTVSQLIAQKITLTFFCKTLFNTINSADIKQIAAFADKYQVAILKEDASSPGKLSALDAKAQNKEMMATQARQNSAMSPSRGDFAQNQVKDQLLAQTVVSFIKQGNVKESLELLDNKTHLLTRVIDTFGNPIQLSPSDLKALVSFLQALLNSPAAFPPEVMAEIKKKYEKYKKFLSESNDIEEELDASTLSNEAKAFIKSFSALKHTYEDTDDVSDEMADAYSALLAKLGIEEE